MKKTGLLCFCLLLIALSGCDSGKVYSEWHELEDMMWSKDEVFSFNAEIEEAAQYQLVIGVRYISEYPYETLDVVLTKENPDGTVTTHPYQLRIKNEMGEYYGEGAGDYWDLEQVVEGDLNFPQTGTYHFTLRHAMPQDIVTHVMEVGLILREVGE